ncbi:dihydrolipoyl dehydrogenase family protein [Lederbergia citrea]|uniref:dihydrolipoyl dehydrogenase family protein n=1 Tax=Lederbergia citrea TaxID=2833581 RepID=UPI001BC8EB4B|nr:NAD(P)/FAD-dependent oxidoreductase [Lederbergia citrea]MBS4177561.1 NAD(P)/FAD-dependent oxidoreductase [Lederbergia citrea]
MVVGELVQEKDLVIIGGGPAGYTAAIRAAQLGREVLLIEKNKLGGVCLNEGCIPSKTFVHAAKQKARLKKMEMFGYSISEAPFDLQTFYEHRNSIIANLRKGVESLCKANKIEIMYGKATFLDEDRIGVEIGHQFDIIRFEHVIIATGAISKEKKKESMLTSVNLFNMNDIPSHLVLAGINDKTLEAAFAYRALGSDVSIIEGDKNGLQLDGDIAKELRRQLKKRKIAYYPEASKISWEEGGICSFVNWKEEKVKLAATHFYQEESWQGNTEGLTLERFGIQTDENNFLLVNKQCKTSANQIFAAGDVTGAPFQAVKGIRQGKTAAEGACGIAGEVDLTWIPTVIQTDPPLAFAGFTEEEAIAAGYFVKIGTYPMLGNGYASLTENKEGIMKVIFEEGTDRLLGVHLFGEGAAELISIAVLGLEMGARDEDFLFPLYPHPSFNEAILEAVEQTKGLSIHQPPKKEAVKTKNQV